MKDKFQNFMYGRYGTDSLNKFLIYASFAFIVLNLFIRNNGVSFLVYAILIYAIFRMFSRNVAARSSENSRFLGWRNKAADFFRNKTSEFRQLRSYHIYRCPNCGQKIRIPRGKGKIMVTCPKCRTKFRKRT